MYLRLQNFDLPVKEAIREKKHATAYANEYNAERNLACQRHSLILQNTPLISLPIRP